MLYLIVKILSNISEALSKVDEDDKAMLKVYDDIHEELKAKTVLIKKAKKKVRIFLKTIYCYTCYLVIFL